MHLFVPTGDRIADRSAAAFFSKEFANKKRLAESLTIRSPCGLPRPSLFDGKGSSNIHAAVLTKTPDMGAGRRGGIPRRLQGKERELYCYGRSY